ncbi:MAG TPA: histidine kinase dimerization/phospho-acceptor domain-containing protein, partial [Verrucomicrobiae bacterium]|nr:histidine kinase dimerization/phospho-acceptor domain-containing protein [Verrucomicrobiae bacterium]
MLNHALRTAWKTGELVVTPPVKITPGDARESRVVVFAPVYRLKTPSEAFEQSPQNMKGILVGIIKVEDLIEEVLKEWNGEGIEIWVYDRMEEGNLRLLAAPESREERARGEDPLALGSLGSNRLRSVTTMAVADRRWELQFVGTDQYLVTAKLRSRWEVLVLGLVFTMLVAGYLSAKRRQTAEVQRLVSIRTAELNRVNRELAAEIQERARVAEAFRESEARFRVMADTAPVMIWMTGLDGRGTFYNKTLLEFTGRSREEELTDWIAGVHPDDRPRLENYWKTFALREPFEIEYRQRRADGVQRWTLDRGMPRFLPDGAFAGYIGCGIDVTELKEAQQAMRQAHDAAIESLRLKSEFLANMSHEIRTPMNGILGMTDLALRTALSVEQREYLTLTKSSGESLLEIINDILDFSKIEAGRLDLEQAPFLLRESMSMAIKPLALRAHSKRIELSCHVAHDVPEALIGDPVRLRQIVVNLIGNAIKFTERGEIVLRITQEHEGPTGVLTVGNGAPVCRLHCTVTDTGIG